MQRNSTWPLVQESKIPKPQLLASRPKYTKQRQRSSSLMKLVVLLLAALGFLCGLPGPKQHHIPVVGFFHIFSEGSEYARIAMLQAEKLMASGLLAFVDKIFYTAAGSDSEEYELWLPKFFKTDPVPKGGEEVTLERMRQFCKRVPDAIVFYFHTKGAFHQHGNNEYMRRIQMRFLVDHREECVSALENGYNLCGMRFSPFPHFHFPANFFWARCDYVKELVSPVEYMFRPPNITKTMGEKCSGADYGGDRYAAEHWIAMHPAANAVDCLAHGETFHDSFTWGYKRVANWTMDCQPAPRNDFRVAEWVNYRGTEATSLQSPSSEKRQWWLTKWNNGCKSGVRPTKDWEMEELYGEEVWAKFANADTSHNRWRKAIQDFCASFGSGLHCDQYYRLIFTRRREIDVVATGNATSDKRPKNLRRRG